MQEVRPGSSMRLRRVPAGTLRPILEELLAWAMENMQAVMRDRKKAHESKNENKSRNE